jgi:alpha-glucosidase
VPVPWSGTRPPFGFSPEGTTAAPWLPQPADWAGLTVEAEDGDPGSMLALYRAGLRLRRELPALGDGTLRWLDVPEGALAFARDPGFACVVNVSAEPVRLPEGSRVLLSSGLLTGDGAVGPDTAVWLATSPG